MISVFDIQNESLGYELYLIEQDCQGNNCPKRSCTFYTSMTLTKRSAGDSFTIQVRIPTQPWITVTFRPNIVLVDYVTFVMSILSTWTGMSIMSLLPAQIVKLYRRTRRMLSKNVPQNRLQHLQVMVPSLGIRRNLQDRHDRGFNMT